MKYREKFKEIDREEFITTLNKHGKFDKPDYEVYFEVNGGRGAILVLQKKFTEEVNRTLAQTPIGTFNEGSIKLDTAFRILSLWIAGIGWVKIDYDKTFDRYGTKKEVGMLYGLPEDSYKYSLTQVDGDNKRNLGVFSTIKEITIFERFKEFLGKTKPKLTFINW